MTAAARKPLPRPGGDLRVVESANTSQFVSVFRGPHGQVSIPGLRPAGWQCARSQMANGRRLSRREAELVTELLLRDGRTVPAVTLAKRLFQDVSATGPVRELVRRARRKLGGSVSIEATGFGYRIPGRFRPVVPTVCTNCGSPVQWDARDWWCEDCGRGGEVPRMEVIERGVGRRGYEEGTKQGQPWSEQEREFVIAHLDDMNLEELGAALDRTPSAVRGFLAVNRIKKPYVRAGRGQLSGVSYQASGGGERRKGVGDG